MSAPVFSLSIHADYRCRQSGHCCSTSWDVPIEIPIYHSLVEAIDASRLRPAAHAAGLAPFVTQDPPDDAAAIFERTDEGGCVFFERHPNVCVVHRDLGESMLPATCRHFPRLAVRDRRGTFITLSHFCPTAAGLLMRDSVPVEIVSGPPAFPPADYQGLEVTDDDLPPLLHPYMLMDFEGYGAWERHMVARCADLSRTPETVVQTLARDARRLQRWRPGAGTLTEAVAALPAGWEEAAAPASLESSLRLWSGVMRAVPDELLPEPDEEGLDAAYETYVRVPWNGFRGPLNRYLAGKAFASWTAYQGRGVASIVRGLDAALGVVRVEAARQARNAGRRLDADLLLEAFRSADFALNHLATGDELAASWSDIELSNTATTGP